MEYLLHKKENKMILTETAAKEKTCALVVGDRMMMGGGKNRREGNKCQGSDCMTYWRWADEAHTEGYCGMVGKPEFK